MKFECEDINISSYKNNIRVDMKGINFYNLYMGNGIKVIEKLLNEIPTEELEQYILKRKEENE